jgi:hypothetical protein
MKAAGINWGIALVSTLVSVASVIRNAAVAILRTVRLAGTLDLAATHGFIDHPHFKR